MARREEARAEDITPASGCAHATYPANISIYSKKHNKK
jgi:hypothetical protein